jgi:hypothetical protein
MKQVGEDYLSYLPKMCLSNVPNPSWRNPTYHSPQFSKTSAITIAGVIQSYRPKYGVYVKFDDDNGPSLPRHPRVSYYMNEYNTLQTTA